MTDKKESLTTKSTPESPKNSATTDSLSLIEALFALHHTKIEIKLPTDLDIVRALEILNLVDAIACAPGTIPYSKTETNGNYCFVADAVRIKFVVDTLHNLDAGDITALRYNLNLSQDFDKKHSRAIQNNLLIHNDAANIADKINFMYFLCNYKVATRNTTPEFTYYEKIFKQFLLNKLVAVESETDPVKQNQMLENIMRLFMFPERVLADINDAFLDLGKVKYTNNQPCVPMFASDGLRANLFEMDLTKHYRIMHSVNVSKLKHSADFSNMDINGDFVCKNQKKVKIIFPHKINGLFDCSGYGFDIDRIPDGATIVNLEYATDSFAKLNKIAFPGTVQKLIIKSSMIKNIIKSLEKSGDDAELIACREFMAKYPNIKIVDNEEKLVLQDELQKRKTQKVQYVKPVIMEKTVTKTTPLKPDEWLSPDEVKSVVFKSHPEWQDTANFDRIIQRARNLNTDVRKQTMKHNDQDCLCICEQDIEKLIKNIRSVLSKEEKRVVKTQVQTTPTKQKEQVPVKSKKLKGVKFKKYIPTSVYKQIEKACGDSKTLLVSVLDRINQINHDYTQLQEHTPLQHIDKTGERTTIPNTEYKGGMAATVFIESLDNRRIVLTINPQQKIVIVIAFFLDHVNNKKQTKAYTIVAIPNAARGLLMDGKTSVTRELISSENYVDVEEKLEELNGKAKTQDVVVEQTQVVQTTTVTTTTTTTKTVVTETPVKKPRPRITKHVGTPNTLLDLKVLEKNTENVIDLLEKYIQELKESHVSKSVLAGFRRRILDIADGLNR